jgi:hypothetical protein
MSKFPPIGMSPAVWGPIFWATMHIVSIGYSKTPTDEEKRGATQFYESLAQVIPCPICKEHYRHFLTQMPPVVDNRDTLIEWVFMIHNKVNEQLGYPVITFDQYIQKMRNLSAKNSISLGDQTNLSLPLALPLTLFVGVGIGIGAYALYQKYK